MKARLAPLITGRNRLITDLFITFALSTLSLSQRFHPLTSSHCERLFKVETENSSSISRCYCCHCCCKDNRIAFRNRRVFLFAFWPTASAAWLLSKSRNKHKTPFEGEPGGALIKVNMWSHLARKGFVIPSWNRKNTNFLTLKHEVTVQ